MPELSEILRWSSVSFLGLWFLLSLVRQIDDPRIAKPLIRLDPFHLATGWRLFNRAPMDCRLWIREQDRRSLMSAWRILDTTRGRSWIFWNVRFRPATALHIIVVDLVRHLRERPDWCAQTAPWGQISPSYTKLENYLRPFPCGARWVDRQFAIAFGETVPGNDGSGAFYQSPFFAVAKKAGATSNPDTRTVPDRPAMARNEHP